MTVHIHLPAEVEGRLQQQGDDDGKDISTWVREAVEEKLASESRTPSPPGSDPQWEAAFDAWISAPCPAAPFVDDSRDTIYSDRGQ